MGPGRKTLEWQKVRAELKKQFEAMGITHCEACGSDFILSFAHSLKRRHITTPEQLREVALLCQKHHAMIEAWPETEMAQFVRNIIAKRQRR